MIKIKLGDYNDLTVQEVAYREGKGERFGLYLDGGRDGEILMPDKYVPEGTQVGDTLRVFVYLDQEERPIATTEKPLADSAPPWPRPPDGSSLRRHGYGRYTSVPPPCASSARETGRTGLSSRPNGGTHHTG